MRCWCSADKPDCAVGSSFSPAALTYNSFSLFRFHSFSLKLISNYNFHFLDSLSAFSLIDQLDFIASSFVYFRFHGGFWLMLYSAANFSGKNNNVLESSKNLVIDHWPHSTNCLKPTERFSKRWLMNDSRNAFVSWKSLTKRMNKRIFTRPSKRSLADDYWAVQAQTKTETAKTRIASWMFEKNVHINFVESARYR